MKIVKKLISMICACLAVPMCTFGLNAMADSTPEMYAKLREGSGNKVRVDIYLKNVPSISSGGFHVVLGSGLSVAHKPDGSVWKEEDDETYAYHMNGFQYTDDPNTGGLFIAFAKGQGYNMNLDMPLTSFYATKVSGSTNTNTTANIVLSSTDLIFDIDHPSIVDFDYTEINTLTMTKSVKYKLGDSDGDNDVDSIDSYNINYALAYISSPPYWFSVPAIENTFVQYFPNASDSYALDPNCDGKVSPADAVAINQYLAAGSSYSGNIGKNFYHCYY